LQLLANLRDASSTQAHGTRGRVLYTTHPEFGAALTSSALAPWCVVWSLSGDRG
jgi:hypothetical protein